MTSYNIKFTNYDDLSYYIKQHDLNSKKSLLIQIFSGVLKKDILKELSTFLIINLPKAKLIGTTTDGEILDNKVVTKKIIISFSSFEHSTLKISNIEKKDNQNSYEIGKNLAKNLLDKKSKVFILFATGIDTNGEDFLKGIKKIAPNIVVAGGLAGDNAKFKETYIISNNHIQSSGAVGISINSDELYINNHYSLTWENLGKTFTINKSYKNIIYKIDNMTPYDLYKKYLGDEIANRLPGIGIEFPLIIQKDGEKIARAPLKIQDDGSIVFGGNIKRNSKVRFGIGNIDELIQGSSQLVNRLNNSDNESIFIYSCMARRRFFDDKASLDIKGFNKIAPTCGFFTYGEFFSTPNSNELLNESLTILALSENKLNLKNKKIISNKKISTKLLKQKALSNIINTTSKELENLNKKLEKRVEKKTEENREQEKYIFEKEKMVQMGEMIENIAHQWRQPLSAISSNTSSIIVQKKLNIIDDDLLIKKMEKIVSYTQFLSQTIDTFRNYLKEEKDIKEVIIQDRLDVVINIISTTLKEFNIKLINNINYNKPIKKLLTIGDLSQVILNIFNNAKDILVEKKISNPWIKIDCKPIKGNILITIEDNGGGIKDELLSKVFDPYFTTKHKSQGTGIGLYMSYNIIIKNLNGNIYVKNTENGAKFFIEIPIK